MNLFENIRMEIIAAAREIIGAACEDIWLEGVTVESPREAAHGDMATNAAMALAGRAGRKPRELAEALAVRLRALPDVTRAEIAGPGFINLSFAPLFWQRHLRVILEEGIGYGTAARPKNIPVNVEYVSANPTGPMHIGHARGAVVGDALAGLLLKAGYDVTKEYYVNDAGSQVDTLARSAYLRYREACGEAITIPEGLYPGEYLRGAGEGLKHTHGRSLLDLAEEEWLPIVRPFAIDSMLTMIRADLADLGIHHDVFFSERSLHESGAVAGTLAHLEESGLVYRGVLEPPKGKTPEDWEPREQTLFRAAQFGDDSDRPLQKSDGSWTYFASDVAYMRDKLKRGFSRQVLVLGADHGGYVKRMQAVMQALGGHRQDIQIVLCQLVKFMEAGEPVKMSKRSGTFTTVRDVLDAVGRDVLRFIMLTRKPEQPLDFDLAKVTEQSKDNPVFYVQYAHARCKSLLRLAAAEMPEALKASASPSEAALARLGSPAELALIRKLASWPRMVEAAALASEPHRIAYFLQELAAEFHGFWNLGNSDTGLRFVLPDAPEVTSARLTLASSVAAVIASGLQVLGVTPVEEMR